MNRPNLAHRLAATAFLSLAAACASAAYPDKPVTLVVTYPPGGTIDAVARVMGPKLAEELGQSVIIENRGGAGGMIGGAAVAKSRPDGYTLMFDASNHAQNPALQPRMSFDTLNDFDPVSLVLRVPTMLAVTPSYKVKSVKELIALGKNPAEPVYYASSGPGSSTHLAGELFNLLAGTKLVHVPYKGGGPAMVDLMGGQVPVMFASMGSAWPHVQSGKLRAVAAGGSQRSPVAPDLPTIAESGVPGYEMYEWNAIFAPAGTPLEIREQVARAVVRVLADPGVKEKLAGIGAETVGSTPAELDTFRRAEISKWEKVAKEAGLKLD